VSELPKGGVDWKVGLDWKTIELQIMSMRASDGPFDADAFGHNWPQAPANAHLVAKEAGNLFFNILMTGHVLQPSCKVISTELTAIINGILRAPADAYCTLTSGGTEANMLAALAAREWAHHRRPTKGVPNIVAPESAHATIDKAAHYLNMSVTRVPVGADYRADVRALRAAITADTVMLVGSAPSWPYGLMDPIPEIAEIARMANLWMHVDAAVGGFLVPFLRRDGVSLPNFDFDVPGVTSITANLHKSGHTPTGVSSLTVRSEDLRQFQRFAFSNWPYAPFAIETLVGSRTASPFAAAWAMMRHLGEDGYVQMARDTKRAMELVAKRIVEIPGLRLLAPPEAGILLFTSDEIDVRAIREAMTRRGYRVGALLRPQAVHLLIDPTLTDYYLDGFIAALKESCADARKTGATQKAGTEVYM